ncbi:MAG: hypothetical protein BWY85_01934 [Firmicutes bacterium ADurb.Bin506]|nr:MAG: hypothetical protein BWY85_01934 [Firmicutes bacterium ADurb.Bin506]
MPVSRHSRGRNGENLTLHSTSARNLAMSDLAARNERVVQWYPGLQGSVRMDMPCGAYPQSIDLAAVIVIAEVGHVLGFASAPAAGVAGR